MFRSSDIAAQEAPEVHSLLLVFTSGVGIDTPYVKRPIGAIQPEGQTSSFLQPYLLDFGEVRKEGFFDNNDDTPCSGRVRVMFGIEEFATSEVVFPKHDGSISGNVRFLQYDEVVCVLPTRDPSGPSASFAPVAGE